jgi:hypothetical protein
MIITTDLKARGLSVAIASIYAMVENLDANIGRLMAHLDRSGRA